MFPKYNFTGINVDIITYAQMLNQCDQWLADKKARSRHIACVNVNCSAEAIINPDLGNIFNKADIVGPDSMPFVYWIRFFTGKKCDRLYAPDIILEIGKACSKKHYSVYLYGGAKSVPEKMRKYLEIKFPFVKIVGAYSPPFRKMTPEEDDEICRKINKSRPDFIFVGLGSPKQDIWIQDHLEKIPGTVMVASGAGFDFFSGRIAQAPLWIQKSGFEWLFRLAKDPRRLWKRYTYYNVIFLWNFLLQLLCIKKFPVR